MSHTHLIISPKLKHKVDRYDNYVNIVNAVLFIQTWIEAWNSLLTLVGTKVETLLKVKFWFVKQQLKW